MEIVNAAERPSTRNLLYPAMIAAEDPRLPHPVHLDRFPEIVIGPSPGIAIVVPIRISFIRSGSVVHALGVGEVSIQVELMRCRVMKRDQEGVVVRSRKVAEIVDRRNLRVKGDPTIGAPNINVVLADQVVSRTTLVPDSHDHLLT